jgi:hypothetical protein
MKQKFKDNEGNEHAIVRRALNPEIKVVDAERGIVDYVASDETLDHHGEIVTASGWSFTHFRKNSPLLNSHMSYDIGDVLGKVLSAEVTGGQLVERAQWAIGLGHAAADVGWKLTEAGFLKAVSVGYYCTKRASRWKDEKEFQEEIERLGIDSATAAMVNSIHLEKEQLELSAVVIGANPNALAKGFEAGAIAEEDLWRLGFGGDEEFDFLAKAAEAVDAGKCDRVFKSMIAVEMKRIFDGRPGKDLEANLSRKKAPTPGTRPGTLSGGRDAERKAAERADFLNQLGQLSQK